MKKHSSNLVTLRLGLGRAPAIGLLSALLSSAGIWSAHAAEEPKLSPVNPPNISIRHEVNHAISKGLAYLEKNQGTNGAWSSPDQPALTALVLSAFQTQPDRELAKDLPAIKKGYDFLKTCVQPDGGIYRKEIPSYNTSVCLMAFLVGNQPEFRPIVANARKYLIGLQTDLGEPGKIDTAYDGGFGYGNSDRRPDLSNTILALEALYYSRQLGDEKTSGEKKELNYAAAIHFIQSCQNLPEYNKEKWASGDPENRGGFIYAPSNSMAGVTNTADQRVALRSYGSMTYAGLLSYAYADMKPDDPRVTAAVEWLKRNFTLEENPGMGLQGLYYFYMLMAKALTIMDIDTLDTADGKHIKWREELALKLINLQKADGSWVNENGRWWQKDPVLVTAFSVITLEIIHRKI